MRLFGFEITWRRAAKAIEGEVLKAAPQLNAVQSGYGWWSILRESFSGAFQSNVEIDSPREILAYSAVFACATTIAADVAKMRVRLMRQNDATGIWREVTSGSPVLRVLRKPNRYQTRLKFFEQWMISKLLHGNAYVLKQRDPSNAIAALYVLDPARVTPLVAADGSVYYRLARDDLSQLSDAVTVPASEIIHDMMVSLWHPLVGVSPIYACAMSATHGNRIQGNSAQFFENMSRPSGVLTAPGSISDTTAARVKALWESNFRGENLGRVAVLGDGLKYEAMTIPAAEAQLIEQLRWTVEDVARAFKVPLYKLGGTLPANADVEVLNQIYYSDCLQAMIESAEILLDEGLGLPEGTGTEFDLDNLLRMDSSRRYARHNEAIKAGWLAPNEARRMENLEPVAGGESPYLQQQNFSLAALARRDALPDPFSRGTAGPAAPANDDDARALADLLTRRAAQ